MGFRKGACQKIGYKVGKPQKIWLAYKGCRLKKTFPIRCGFFGVMILHMIGLIQHSKHSRQTCDAILPFPVVNSVERFPITEILSPNPFFLTISLATLAIGSNA